MEILFSLQTDSLPTGRSTSLMPSSAVVAAMATVVTELFRESVGSKLDLQRGHHAWFGPSSQASMHCGLPTEENMRRLGGGRQRVVPDSFQS